MKHEPADPEEIDCYNAGELSTLLAHADQHLRPCVALAGLAGIRLTEIMRLTWEDVFRVPGHIEITAFKAKTRSRRLTQVCPALAAWLEPHRDLTGAVWAKSYDMFHLDFATLRDRFNIPTRRNGLRHSFVSAHYALYSDEGLTAAQADNSPSMVHKNYKGLLTKAAANKWFAVKPAKAVNVIRLHRQKASA